MNRTWMANILKRGVTAFLPETFAHIKRVESDDYDVYSKSATNELIRHAIVNGYYDDLSFLAFPEGGILENYVAGDGAFAQGKADLSANGNDATQGSASAMPRVSRPDNKGNAQRWSEDFTKSDAWRTPAARTITPDVDTVLGSPVSRATGDYETDGTLNIIQVATHSRLASGRDITVDVTVKYVDHQWHRISYRDADGSWGNTWIDVQNGTLGSAEVGFDRQAIDLGGGYTRFIVSFPNADAESRLAIVAVTADGATARPSVEASIDITRFAYRAADWDDTYIPTTTARQFANGGLPAGRRTLRYFDGEHLRFPDAFMSNLGINEGAVAAVFRTWPDLGGGGNRYMFRIEFADGEGIRIYNIDDGRMLFRRQAGAGNDIIWFETTDYSPATWYCVVWRYSISRGKMTLYVNGSQFDEMDITAVFDGDGSFTSFRRQIGTSQTDGASPWNEAIASFKVMSGQEPTHEQALAISNHLMSYYGIT